MPEFVATLARTVYTSVRFEAANEAEAAKMAETMQIAFEQLEPCDVAVTKISDRPGLRLIGAVQFLRPLGVRHDDQPIVQATKVIAMRRVEHVPAAGEPLRQGAPARRHVKRIAGIESASNECAGRFNANAGPPFLLVAIPLRFIN